MIQLWDATRYVSTVCSVLIVGAAVYSIIYPMAWDQRIRIGFAAVIFSVVLAAQVSQLGTPPASPWRTAVLCVGSIGFMVGMIALAIRQRRQVDSTGDDIPSIRKVDSLASTPAAMIVADNASRIVAVAGQCEPILGYTSAQLVGRPLATLIPTRYRDQHFAGVERMMETGEQTVTYQPLALEALHRSGREIPIELVVIPLGESRRFLGIVQRR